LQLSFNLSNGVTLRAQFTYTTKLRQRIEIVNEVGRHGRGRCLDDALFSPTSQRLLAQTEQLFDLFY
jgi:hypothetical protein